MSQCGPGVGVERLHVGGARYLTPARLPSFFERTVPVVASATCRGDFQAVLRPGGELGSFPLMRYHAAASSGLEPGGARIRIHSVENFYGHFRIDGECTPTWLGPPQDAKLSIDGAAVQLETLEIGIAGRFALEAKGEPQAGDTINLRLGEGWVILLLLDDR